MMLETMIRILILLAPFFVLSVFVVVTEGTTSTAKRRTALRTGRAILITSFIVYFLGNFLLKSLGITLDAFRIGAGLVLLLSGLDMVRASQLGAIRAPGNNVEDTNNDVSIVPLTIPCAIGPGTMGALLMMGENTFSDWRIMTQELLGITAAIGVITLLLYFADFLERYFGRRVLGVLSKLTGLFLAALASQIICDGIKNIFF